MRSYIEQLTDFSQIPANVFDVIKIDPDFDNVDQLRIKSMRLYLEDNGLPQYVRWINLLIFYFANQMLDINIKSDDCAICLDTIEDNTCAVLKCKHFFHYKCIKKWQKKRNACPKCNKIIIYRCIMLPHRLCDNIEKIMDGFTMVENIRLKFNDNKNIFTRNMPRFSHSYLLYQLITHIKLTLSDAEEHCLLDNVNELGNINIIRHKSIVSVHSGIPVEPTFKTSLVAPIRSGASPVTS